jgi:ATP-dependent 26S proteasome regulatory subunit
MLLVERMSDNMASVGALLNLADGIFGVLADVRIVATTNAGKLDIDPALIRNGRLCRHIEIPHLGSERAREIYQRLTGKAEAPAFARDAVLADVYQAARPDIQKKPEPAEKPGLGFRRA